ncbi:uncharacterized protein [Amphiura filiformis]|uniref:uncharacterized protein n=1 Tax=Amphiura filiformis TaxID=82378 RepID=UPI003B210F11
MRAMTLIQGVLYVFLFGCVLCWTEEDNIRLQNEFIFSVPHVGLTDPVTIWITTPSSKPICTSLTIPGVGFAVNNTMSKDNPVEIRLPDSINGTDLRLRLRDQKQNKTFVVRSSATVSVHAIDNEKGYGDGFAVFPSSQLGTQYYVASYKRYLIPSFLCISSLYSNTSIIIKTPAGQLYQILLEKHESYRFDGGYDNHDDLSGTLVQSDKPVAVISGINTRVPDDRILSSGGLIEQLPHTQSWGYKFTLSPFLSLNSGYVYRVYTTNISATLLMSNGNIAHIPAESFHEGNVINDTIVSFTSDKPIMVVQYMKGFYANDPGRGSPSMLIVPPITSFNGNITFPVIKYDISHTYYINVVIECVFIDGLFLDDLPLISEDTLKSHDQSMCCLRTSLSDGQHSISHTNSSARFAVSVYALSYFSSYAYSANVLVSSRPHSSEPGFSTTSYSTSPSAMTDSSRPTTDFADVSDESEESEFNTAIVVGAGVAGGVVLICIIILILHVVRTKRKRSSNSTRDESAVTGANGRIDNSNLHENNVYQPQDAAENAYDNYQEINNGSQEYAYAYADGQHPMHPITRNDDSNDGYAYAETSRVQRPSESVAEGEDHEEEEGWMDNTVYVSWDKTRAEENAQEGWMDNSIYSSE